MIRELRNHVTDNTRVLSLINGRRSLLIWDKKIVILRLKTQIKFFLNTNIWVIPYLWILMEIILEK